MSRLRTSLQTVAQKRGALVGPTLISAFKDGGRRDELTLTGTNHPPGIATRTFQGCFIKATAVMTANRKISQHDKGSFHREKQQAANDRPVP